MTNDQMITLTLKRSDALRVRLALSHVGLEFRKEMLDPNITEDHLLSCAQSCAMWESIHDEIVRQMSNHDKED